MIQLVILGWGLQHDTELRASLIKSLIPLGRSASNHTNMRSNRAAKWEAPQDLAYHQETASRPVKTQSPLETLEMKAMHLPFTAAQASQRRTS